MPKQAMTFAERLYTQLRGATPEELALYASQIRGELTFRNRNADGSTKVSRKVRKGKGFAAKPNGVGALTTTTTPAPVSEPIHSSHGT